MILFTLRGDYRRANTRALTLLGVNQDEFARRNPASLVNATERYRFLRLLIQLRRKKSAAESFTLLRESKSALAVEARCAPVGGDYYIAILHEIGDRVAVERELRRSEQEYRSLVEKHPDGIAVLLQNELVLANGEFRRLFGISGDGGPQNLSVRELFTTESWRKLQKVISDKGELQPGRLELWCKKSDASTFVANVGFAPVQYRAKRCVELSVADNSLQKKLLDTIAASESRFRSMIEGSRTPQALLREGKIEVANAAAVELFGMEVKGTLNGAELAQLVDEPSRPLLEPLLIVREEGRSFP
jgi:PAS domain S-box-containing protein